MPKYKRTNATAKSGINFVRGIVEASGSIFHKIEQENDLGIDGQIELTRNEVPLHKQIGVQIKSGESYCVSKSRECLIPIDGHREYWAAYPLPVIGLVFVPSLQAAYWVDIKSYLKRHPTDSVIRFQQNRVNIFNGQTFERIFVPLALSEIPQISYEQASQLFESSNADELQTGLLVLFRRFPNRLETWDQFAEFFKRTSAENIPLSLIYYFAHVPWHGDLYGYGEQLSETTRSYVRNTHFQKFGSDEIEKLLSLIDNENGIRRGTIGQSVEAIVSSLPNRSGQLQTLIKNGALSQFIREMAALIYAMHEPNDALPFLEKMGREGSQFMKEMADYVRESGRFDPYV